VRDAFADALIAARRRDPLLFVLDGDCARSTRTSRFEEIFPESFLNVGIAEQNLVGIAAGLALRGFRPVACSFAAMLSSRAAEQIMLSVAYQHLPIVLAGHYGGLSGAFEGAPHHSIADLAYLRAVPGLDVYVPADDDDVAPLFDEALLRGSPAYFRLCRDPVSSGAAREWREGVGWCRVHGDGVDVALVACGIGVREGVRAAERLEPLGIDARVIGLPRLKPLDPDGLRAALAGTGVVVTVEEHSVNGGLGAAVAEALAADPVPVHRLGIRDTFTETGPYEDLLRQYGLTAEAIVDTVLDVVGARQAV
jgi:transketolase